MKIKKMSFADVDAIDNRPETVTVEMDIEEALWIAKVAGMQRGTSPHTGIYLCLVVGVFNRYWDDGVDDAVKWFPFDIPPITYPSPSSRNRKEK